MIGCLPTQALAFLAVFVYATHATQAIAFEWKPVLSVALYVSLVVHVCAICRYALLEFFDIIHIYTEQCV